MLIIVGREHEGLYEGLKGRQEANGKDRVILDRRRGERRQVRSVDTGLERRRDERRRPLTDAERALMNVLGFAVLQRELRVISGKRAPRKPVALRSPARAPTRSRKNAAS